MDNQISPKSITILILEDDPFDVELEISELEEAGYVCEWTRVETEEEFLTTLHSSDHIDLILADYNLPAFDGLTALRLFQELEADIPFILVSGTVGEEFAIESLKAGATDYVIKDRLYRLGPVVNRALLEFESKKARHQAELVAQLAFQQRIELINAIEGIVWEVDLSRQTLTFISAQAERLLGYAIPEWLSEANFWDRHLHPEDKGKVESQIDRAIKVGEGIKLEYRMIAKNGRIVWFQDMITPVKMDNKVVALRGIMVDITHQKEIEAALKQSEARLQDAQKMALIGSWEWDMVSGTIIWSDGMFNVYDIPHAQTPDIQLVRDLIIEEDLDIFDNAFVGIEEGKIPEKIEYRIKGKDGQIKYITSNAKFELNQNGEIIGLKGTIQDISERKYLEEQLQFAQKMEAIGQFTAGIAHDFNNILTAINGTSELLDIQVPESSPFKKLIRRIKFAGEKAANLIAQLMTFSQKHIYEIQSLNLNKIIQDLEMMLHPIIGEDIQLNPILTSNLWGIEGDLSQVEQIIVNLVANAKDAMPDGGTLTIKTANISQKVFAHESEPHHDYVLLTIEDTGHGIPKSLHNRIFEPFFTTKEVDKGTGLGLSTVYGIVKKLNGFIEVESGINQGTCFSIYFPKSDKAIPSVIKESEIVENLQGHETLLLVEDNKEVRELTLEILKIQGYNVLQATNGAEALHVSSEYSGSIDLLVTDVVMPKMNGNILAAQLLLERPDLKVIFMSGYADSKLSIEDFIDKGHAFLQKPFSPTALTQKIRQML